MSKYSIFYAVKKFSDFPALCSVKRNLVKCVNEFNRKDKKNKETVKEKGELHVYMWDEIDCTDASYLKWQQRTFIFVDSITASGQKQ